MVESGIMEDNRKSELWEIDPYRFGRLVQEISRRPRIWPTSSLW